uniref:Uncharacterized protein n=1 Tax=Rhizophora mucronata TaxID=61149 RepID=A0A2P2QWS7_RHIMU
MSSSFSSSLSPHESSCRPNCNDSPSKENRRIFKKKRN